MNCFKVFKTKHHKNENGSNENEILNEKINEILLKYNRVPIKAHDQQTLGELILENINSPNTNNRNETEQLIEELVKSNLIQVNNIKNFLNQTLLHFACENNDLKLCNLLVENKADFLFEDNYRQSPFILAAKRNNLDLIKLFSALIKKKDNDEDENDSIRNNFKQIKRATYFACCSGNLEIVKFLFETFCLHSELLLDDYYVQINEFKLSELNVLHVVCYKAQFEIAEYLLKNSINIQEFINSPINEFRESTCLEEAFKGLLALDFGKKIELNKYGRHVISKSKERETKKTNYELIINLLIENNGKFSKNFIQLNGLSKILLQVFSGINKDLDFVHFLDCCKFLFIYKLNEIFIVSNNDCLKKFDYSTQNMDQLNKERLLIISNTNNTKYLNESKLKPEVELDLEKAVDEFLFKVYLISMRVLKDYKYMCLNKYFEIIVNLYKSGQVNMHIKKFIYLKERNNDIYKQIEEALNKPQSLKTLAIIAIRNSTHCFGINKINEFNIPRVLKQELFLNQI